MKKLGIYLAIIFCALLNLFCVHAKADVSDRQTSEGTEFIFSFFPNHHNNPALSLFITSKVDASGFIEIPRLNSRLFFEVAGGELIKVPLVSSLANLPKGVVSDYGIRVTSDFPITVYGLNRLPNTTDAFLILPTKSLGKKYYTITYGGYSAESPSQIAIVATRDNTAIEITAPVATTKAKAGVTQKVTLNAMQTFLVSASAGSSDLTGTKIISNAPVAVTSGASCTNIPYGVAYCDLIAEMIPPVNTWGVEFISYPLAKRLKGDLVRVLASEDNTKIKINGVQVKTLAAGSYYDLLPTAIANKIETSAPVLVAQYALGQNYDNILADPFSMLVPPTEQLLNAYTFATSNENIDDHYINVVIRTVDIPGLHLDDLPVDVSVFKTIDTTYSGAKIQVTPGIHTIRASSPFTLLVYGFGDHESYGYPGGMAVEAINPENQDYRNVRVISTLNTQDITLDPSSFTLQPEKITQANQQTVIEWFFPSFSIGQIKNLEYELLAKNLQPGESRIITNNLELNYQDINNVEHKRELGVQTLEVLSSGFGLNIATDKTIYGPEEKVLITTTASNAGTSQVVMLYMEVRDTEDRYVAAIETIPGFILSGGTSITLSPQEFFTGSYFAGDYKIVAQLKDAQNLVQQETSATIRIQSELDGIVQLANQTHTDKYTYTSKDVVNIENITSNNSANQYLEKARLIIRVTHENDVLWNESVDLIQLAPSSDETKNFSVSLTNAAAGNYVVESTIIDPNGATLASSLAPFTVEDNPLLSLSANVSVSETEYEIGETPSCSYQILNSGSVSVSQDIALRLVRIDEATEIFGLEKVVQLSPQANDLSTPVLPSLQDEGDYACILEVKKDSQFQTMASAQFHVKVSPITFNGDIRVGDKTRLLILVDEVPNEKTYLNQLLANNGWLYTIVSDADDFKSELQLGSYGAYVLLSEKVTLTPETRDLLKIKVKEGDGLLVANGHDRRHKSLEEALGVRVHAKQTKIKGITANSDLLGRWTYNFDQAINSMTFDLNGAELAGQYIFSTDPADQPNALGAASEFNVFALEDYTSLSSSIDGRLAVGGNLNLQNFGVGEKLTPNLLQDVVSVGGNVTFPSGKIYNGNLVAAGNVLGVGDAVRFGLTPGAAIRGNTSIGIDFESEREWLQELSSNLSKIPANGKTKMKWGGLELTGDCSSSQQVFSVSAADLSVAHTFAVSCIPSGATVIFNVPGQNVSIQNIGMQSLTAIREKVIFNFPQANNLLLKSVAIEGSVLAPFAKVDQPAGRIEGQVIVRSWNSTNNGYMSIHNKPFGGDLSAQTQPKSDNAIATYQFQKGKTVFVGFDLLAQSASLSGGVNPFEQSLLSALTLIVPDEIRAGKFIGITVSAENTGKTGTLVTMLLGLPSPIEMAPQNDFLPVLGTQDWAWTFMSQPGEFVSKQIYVRLLSPGSNLLLLKLQTQSIVRFEKSLTLSVQ